MAQNTGVVVATLLLLAAACSAYKEIKKTCPEGCEKYGNCNHEEGRCECPWAYGGPDCSRLMLPACRQTPDSKLVSCDESMVKNCECFRQCMSYIRQPGAEGQPRFLRDDISCYTYDGVPEAEQLSTLPSADQTNVKFFRGYIKGRQQPARRQDTLKVENWVVQGYAVPLQLCPEQCNLQGSCLAGGPDAKNGFCACFKGFAGRECKEVMTGTRSNNCVNDCNGIGKCISGFCHCPAGHFGKDCSRSKAYEPDTPGAAFPHPTKLRIYVYELPTWIAHEDGWMLSWNQHDPIYTAYQHFMASLYKDWAVRTENPWEANLFYVPALTYFYSSNVGPMLAWQHLEIVLRHIKKAYPFWNKNQGRDHILWLSLDRGACEIPADSDAAKPIKLLHFAYYHHHNHKTEAAISRMDNNEYGCYLPTRDVTAAPYFPDLWQVAKERFIDPGTYKADAGNLKLLLFFAGGVRHDDKEYSGGVRQYLHAMFKDGKDPEISINEGGVVDYVDKIRSSKFCLSAYGHGWGIRTNIYMAHGCVPVIIQDHVFQPYEDVLPYERFSVRLRKSQLPQLADILRSISPEELTRLRQGVSKYWRAFIWDQQAGGQAYNFTVLGLQRRYRHLAGEHYKKKKLLAVEHLRAATAAGLVYMWPASNK